MNEDRRGLINGTAIYFLGNISITIAQLLLLRFVTGKLEPEIYGYFNLVVTIDNLVTPMLTIQIGDALFRFFFSADELKRKSYYSICMVGLITGLIIITIALNIVNIFYNISSLPWIIAYIFSTNVYLIYQKIARSMQQNKVYVQANFIKALSYMILQMICLYVFNWKIESLFFANVGSTLIFVGLLERRIKSWKYFSIKTINRKDVNSMVSYSAPLVPNTMFWWLNSSVNNVIISNRLGLESNGIFSIANKFPNILNTVASVFMLSWQESMIKNFDNKKGKSSFCNETFNMFYALIFTSGMAAVMAVRIIFPYMIADSYSLAIKYIPVIMISVCFSNISGFFGQIYGAVKDTKGIMKTTMMGTVVNLSLTLGLVGFIGLWAPIIGTLLSNIVLTIGRYFRFKNQMSLSVKKSNIIILLVEVLIIMLTYYQNKRSIYFISFVLSMIIFLLLNNQIIKDFYLLVKEKLKG